MGAARPCGQGAVLTPSHACGHAGFLQLSVLTHQMVSCRVHRIGQHYFSLHMYVPDAVLSDVNCNLIMN